MRSQEFITESAKLWSAKVRVNQPNYVGYVDAQVWAPNANIARTILKQQYQIQDHHVGSVKEIRMKAKEFVKEALKLPAGVADQAVQYISGPMLPKPGGQYRLQDVLKRVKEIKDAIARAKQSGRLDVNSAEYKDAMAEIKKWADWLEASQAPVQPGTPVINIGEELNPNLGKILAAANKFASSVANMKIYVDDLFANHLKFGGLTAMVDWYKKNYTDKDYANAKQEAAQARQELERLGVKVDYNESFPTDFTLNIPGQSQPYSFNIIKLLKDAMDTFSTKSTNEALSRMADLAGVPLKEAWNANMGEIYEAANSMALAVYNLAILSNPAFRKREDSDGRLYATLQKFDPEDFEDTKELSQRDLADHGAKLTYNANNPRMFTLHVPKMEPYTFDVKEVVDTAVG